MLKDGVKIKNKDGNVNNGKYLLLPNLSLSKKENKNIILSREIKFPRFQLTK
jgi:hypothetical protein